MDDTLHKNGFIIKSYCEVYLQNNSEKYLGIGRHVTWPLDELADEASVKLTREAWKRWFGYSDQRPEVVPDLDYLQRYKMHCNNLHIPTYCLQIESTCNIITSPVELPILKVLGFDYVDADMQTSCMREDLDMEIDSVIESFKPIQAALNRFGLIDSLEAMYQYIEIRNNLIGAGYDMEEYYSPIIARLSVVEI